MKSKLLLIILPFLLFNACKSKKKLVLENKNSISKDSLNVANASTLLNKTLINWTFFSSKMNINFDNGTMKNEVDANLRMYKDSLIWISISLFGIEGARVLINKDSAIFLDKLHKTYMVFKKDQLKSMIDIPVELKQLQNILLAQPILPLHQYQYNQEQNSFSIQSRQNSLTFFHQYNSDLFTISMSLVKDVLRNSENKVNYSNFTTVDQRNIPQLINLDSKTDEKNTKVLIELKDSDFITELTFPLTIPKSYEKTN